MGWQINTAASQEVLHIIYNTGNHALRDKSALALGCHAYISGIPCVTTYTCNTFTPQIKEIIPVYKSHIALVLEC